MVSIDNLKLKKKGIQALLSPLEAEVLEVLWKLDSAKARDIYSILKKKRSVALTSVAVMLDRLHSKKLVTRKAHIGRGGEHYVYVAASTKEEFEKTVVEDVVDKLISNFGHVAVNYFNERFKEEEK